MFKMNKAVVSAVVTVQTGDGGIENPIFIGSSSFVELLPPSYAEASAGLCPDPGQKREFSSRFHKRLVKCTKGRWFYLSYSRSHNWAFRNKLGSACDLQ